MIRFSAGLVVVAIGVLIGGVATSKLSLVYAAIAVSAVALIVLAIGVALKRDELFGEAPESAAANSGASAVPTAEAGLQPGNGHVTQGQAQDQAQRRVKGPATAAFEAADAAQKAAVAAPAAHPAPTVAVPSAPPPPVGSPVGGRTVASPSVAASTPAGSPPLEQRRPAFGQPSFGSSPAQGGDGADWQSRSATPDPRPSWSPPERTPAEPAPAPSASVANAPAANASAGNPPSELGSAGNSTAATMAAGNAAAATLPPPPLRGWGSPDPAGSPAPAGSSASAGLAGSTPRAESSTAAPSWFDRMNRSAGDSSPGPGGDTAKAAPSASAEPPTVARATIKPGQDEQHEPDEQSPSDDLGGIRQADTAVETQAVAAMPGGGVADTNADTDTDTAGRADADADVDDDDWPTRYSWLEDDESADEPADAFPADAADQAEDAVGSGSRSDETVPAAALTPDEPSAASPAGDVRLVTVIPGVPRYHDPDCILIRFMGDEDVARKSIPEAQADNCTPCAACQPES